MKQKIMICIFFTSFMITEFLFSEIISFYSVKYLSEEPLINGYLNEGCWNKLKKANYFYVDMLRKPIVGKIRTEFMIFYNEKGLYIGILNYDENIEKIRAEKYERDDMFLWMDDTDEIYIDTEGKGNTYTKFTVNFIGTKGDEKKDFTQFNDISWEGNNWEYKTKKDNEKWTVEIFIPWSDIGKRAKEGDLWRFNIRRFSYSSGRFIGVSWSLGCTYMTPGNFGYIYFEKPNEEMSLNKIAEILSRNLKKKWELYIENMFILGNGKANFIKGEELLNKEKQIVDKIFSDISEILVDFQNNKAIVDEFEKIKKEYEKTDEEQDLLTKITKLKEIKNSVEEFCWKLKIEKYFK